MAASRINNWTIIEEQIHAKTPSNSHKAFSQPVFQIYKSVTLSPLYRTEAIQGSIERHYVDIWEDCMYSIDLTKKQLAGCLDSSMYQKCHHTVEKNLILLVILSRLINFSMRVGGAYCLWDRRLPLSHLKKLRIRDMESCCWYLLPSILLYLVLTPFKECTQKWRTS